MVYQTHGHTTGRRSPTWISWKKLKARCNDSNEMKFANYGGRGISYDPRWESFENFLTDMGERPAGTTLDRVDSNGSYSKDNCRWATPKEQRLNSRAIIMVDWQGQRVPLFPLIQASGLHRSTVVTRIKSGWPVEAALTVPATGRRLCGESFNAT